MKVEQQEAEWIEYNALFSRILCSNCGVRFQGYEHCTLYCPECGKKMGNGRTLLSKTNTTRQGDITGFDDAEVIDVEDTEDTEEKKDSTE